MKIDSKNLVHNSLSILLFSPQMFDRKAIYLLYGKNILSTILHQVINLLYILKISFIFNLYFKSKKRAFTKSLTILSNLNSDLWIQIYVGASLDSGSLSESRKGRTSILPLEGQMTTQPLIKEVTYEFYLLILSSHRCLRKKESMTLVTARVGRDSKVGWWRLLC